jgi:hypothetical protein
LWTSADRSRRGVLALGESRAVVAFAATVVAVTALAVAVVAVIALAVACDRGIPSLMLSPCCWQQRGKAGTTTGDELILQGVIFTSVEFKIDNLKVAVYSKY